MEIKDGALKKDESDSLFLRSLYENYGYTRYKMSRFEPYSLYHENINFLKSESVATFGGLDGKLYALKPDVTLSIIKSVNTKKDSAERLYYLENVCRPSEESREFKEISQMGLELIGEAGLYATAEVITLAAKSLACVDGDFVLDLSHAGFTDAVLNNASCGKPELKDRLASALKAKNAHEFTSLAVSGGLNKSEAERLSLICRLSGEPYSVIEKAKDIAGCGDAEKALGELKAVIGAMPFTENIKIDFSVVNDIGYYNGVIMQGYVKEVPHAVLSGGRYDKLLEKFGKEGGAIGFALYLDGLSGYYPVVPSPFDAAVLYDGKTDLKKLGEFMEELTAKGMKAAAVSGLKNGITYKKLYKFDGKGFSEVKNA